MKDSVIIIILTFIAVVLTGCSSEKCNPQPHMDSEIITQENGGSLIRRNGEEHISFAVPDGSEGVVAVSVQRVSGNLNIVIAPEADSKSAVYEGRDVPSSEFTVYAKEAGDYKICVKAENFVGDYSFNISENTA